MHIPQAQGHVRAHAPCTSCTYYLVARDDPVF